MFPLNVYNLQSTVTAATTDNNVVNNNQIMMLLLRHLHYHYNQQQQQLQQELQQQQQSANNSLLSTSESTESTTTTTMMKLYSNDIIKQLQDQIKLMSNDTYRQERIYYGIAYFIIIIISFFGNLLVCRICLKKYTKTNSLILSLSISDLLMTVFNIPFNFFRIANFSWPFGQPMCFIVNFVQYLVVYQIGRAHV